MGICNTTMNETSSLNANAAEFVPSQIGQTSQGCVFKVSADQRYFENPFKSWDELQTAKADTIQS